MSWRKKIIVTFGFVFAIFFLSSCSYKNVPSNSGCCPKLFEAEDRLIMTALDLKSLGFYKDSAKIFSVLYRKTGRVEYKIEQIKLYLAMGRYEEAKKEIADVLNEYPRNLQLLRLAAVVDFHKKDLNSAKKHLLQAVKLSNEARDYEFLAMIYLAQKRYDMALKYYQSAYALQPSDKTVKQMATIMFLYLNKKNDAIAYLETHSRMYGCSKEICDQLAAFYGEKNDIDGVLSVYKRVYEKFGEEDYAKKIAQIYLIKGDAQKAIDFLEQSGADDDFLLDLYKSRQMFDKAAQLALKLYNKTEDLDYLAQNAIYRFEAAKKKDEKLLKEVAEKLEKVIKIKKDALYLNYLGYLYIDHDIDIKRGIELVKEALKQNPQSPYYIDSLAWGYYKLGRCREAMELMEKVIKKLGLKDEEVKLHHEKIKECLKRMRK